MTPRLRSGLFSILVLAFSPAAPALADDLPFVGRWDCGVATFTFTDKTYDTGSEVLTINEAQEGTDGSYTLFFDDDYSITLSGFSDTGMGWFSPASGDSFECKRLKG